MNAAANIFESGIASLSVARRGFDADARSAALSYMYPLRFISPKVADQMARGQCRPAVQMKEGATEARLDGNDLDRFSCSTTNYANVSPIARLNSPAADLSASEVKLPLADRATLSRSFFVVAQEQEPE
jgi:hypothetical protein